MSFPQIIVSPLGMIVWWLRFMRMTRSVFSCAYWRMLLPTHLLIAEGGLGKHLIHQVCLFCNRPVYEGDYLSALILHYKEMCGVGLNSPFEGFHRGCLCGRKTDCLQVCYGSKVIDSYFSYLHICNNFLSAKITNYGCWLKINLSAKGEPSAGAPIAAECL